MHEKGWPRLITDGMGELRNCAKNGRRERDLDPFQAELLGCFTGVQETVNMGVQHICVETDASLVKVALEDDMSIGYRRCMCVS
jgi:hypothetical protein